MEKKRATNRRRWLCAACCFVLLATGCRRGGPEVVAIDGVVTFGGGSWPKPGVVYFTVAAPGPGLPDRPAMGAFDTDGRLTVTTFEKGDGLIPGSYTLAVMCWEVMPIMGDPGKNCVPARYASPATSGLTLVVEPGQDAVKLALDIPKQ